MHVEKRGDMVPSATCAVLLSRVPSGEIVATLGIDFQAPVLAPSGKCIGLDDGPVHPHAVPAHALFARLGIPLPFGVSPMQNVPIFHDGLDALEVLRFVPNHAGGSDGF